ncbi:MAG: hypothetical protein ACYC9Y_00685 [Candidatus Methylomirabilia bacterium]
MAQDIFAINFESEDWQELWEGLRGVVLFWIERGMRIFRVDNPHTKPFPFWEWLIGEIKREHPAQLPARIFRVHSRLRRETDFGSFM